MIEQGIAKLVQSEPSIVALCPFGGGFFVQLPKDQTLPSWTYNFVTEVPLYTLRGQNRLLSRRLQLDLYADKATDIIDLSSAISRVLDGYQGTLADPDATRVQACFRSNLVDFYDDASRTYRRMLEYNVWFNQT